MRVISAGTHPAFDVFQQWDGAADSALPAAIGLAWHVELPEDVNSARAYLDEQARRSRAAQHALPAVDAALLRDLDDIRARGFRYGFAGDTASAAGNPRSVLAAAARFDMTGETFALWDRLPLNRQAVESVVERLGRWSEQVQQAMTLTALVDSRTAGAWIASSRVDWAGNVDTRWNAAASANRQQLHAAVLEQVLATRQNWLRFFLQVTAGAVRVGAVLASGPLSPVAIWAAWNYVQAVIGEYQTLAAGMPEAN